MKLQALGVVFVSLMLASVWATYGVFTNKFTTDAIRGAGRPEGTHMIELTMDAID